MRGSGQRGFTIIETMLFLSVSALLFVGLISGVQVMINSARFSDAVNALQTKFRDQFEEVRSGINTRSGSLEDVCGTGSSMVAPGSSNCLILGKIIRFTDNSSKLRINYVIGNQINSQNSSTDSVAMLASMPRISIIQSEETDIKWGAYYVKGLSLSDGALSTNNYKAIAILRSPLTGTVMTYVFANPVHDTDLNIASSGQIGKTLAFLIDNSSVGGAAGAAICVDGGSTSSSVSTVSVSDPGAGFLINSNELKQLNEGCKK